MTPAARPGNGEVSPSIAITATDGRTNARFAEPSLDIPPSARHYPGMRFILLMMPLFLAACGSNPAALGITGPPMSEPPPDPGENQTGIPGAPQTGTQLSPSMPSNTGAGKFWGYN